MADRKRKVRIGRLDTVGGVCVELGRIYRLARRNEMEMGDAKALTYVLTQIRVALEAKDMEMRIEALEAQREST